MHWTHGNIKLIRKFERILLINIYEQIIESVPNLLKSSLFFPNRSCNE